MNSPCYTLEKGQKCRLWPYLGTFTFDRYVTDSKRTAYIKDASGALRCEMSSDLTPVEARK